MNLPVALRRLARSLIAAQTVGIVGGGVDPNDSRPPAGGG